MARDCTLARFRVFCCGLVPTAVSCGLLVCPVSLSYVQYLGIGDSLPSIMIGYHCRLPHQYRAVVLNPHYSRFHCRFLFLVWAGVTLSRLLYFFKDSRCSGWPCGNKCRRSTILQTAWTWAICVDYSIYFEVVNHVKHSLSFWVECVTVVALWQPDGVWCCSCQVCWSFLRLREIEVGIDDPVRLVAGLVYLWCPGFVKRTW